MSLNIRFIISWTVRTVVGMALPALTIVALALVTMQVFLPPLTMTWAILLAPAAIGAIMGLFQSKPLRAVQSRAAPWVIASSVGWFLASLGLLPLGSLMQPGAIYYPLALGTVFGATVAIPQCLALRRHGPRVAWLIPTSIIGILIGGVLLSSVVAKVQYGNGPGEGILQGLAVLAFLPLSVGLPLGLSTSLAVRHVLARSHRLMNRSGT